MMVDILKFDLRSELRKEFGKYDRCADVLDAAIGKVTGGGILPSQISEIFKALLDWELGSEQQTDMVIENTNVVEIMAAVCIQSITAGYEKGLLTPLPEQEKCTCRCTKSQ